MPLPQASLLKRLASNTGGFYFDNDDEYDNFDDNDGNHDHVHSIDDGFDLRVIF